MKKQDRLDIGKVMGDNRTSGVVSMIFGSLNSKSGSASQIASTALYSAMAGQPPVF